MTTTYDITTTVGQVRLVTGDNTAPMVFTDEEIGIFLTAAGNVVNLAAATMLEAWAAKYGANADAEKIGDYSYTQSIVDRMLKLAAHLREVTAKTPAYAWAEFDFTGETEDE